VRVAREPVVQGEPDRLTKLIETSVDLLLAKEGHPRREDQSTALLDTIPQMVWLTDAAGNTNYFNSRCAEYVGRPAEVANGWGWLDLVHLDDRQQARRVWESAVQSGECYRNEYRVRGADGVYRWYLTQAAPLRGPHGTIERWVGTWTDIDELKRAEARSSRDALLLANVQDAVIVTDLDGVVTYWNDGARRTYGWTADETLGRPLSETFPESQQEELGRVVANVRAGAQWKGEWEVFQKDGSRLWVDIRVSRIYDAEGNPIGIIGISHDIGEQRRVEVERQRLISLIETSPDFIGIADEQRKAVFVNRAGREMVGLPDDVDIRQTHIIDYLAEEDRERLTDELIPAVELHGRWTGEFAFRHFQTRERIPVDWTVFALPRETPNSPTCLACVAQDISERKRSEAELRRTSDLLKAVADVTPDALFVKDAEGRYQLVNPAAAQFVGRAVEDMVGRDDCELFSPTDAQLLNERDHRVMQSGVTETEEEVLTVAGVTRTFLATKAPYRDGNGQIAGTIGVSRDITERKRAEEALRLRDRAIQAVTQGILITDPSQPENPIIYASPGFQNLTGYAVEETVGRNCRFLQGKDTDPAAVAQIRESIHQRRPCTVELLNYRKDGTPFWNELSISPVFNPQGKLTHFVGVQTDVTQRRQFEDQISQAQKMEAIGKLAGGIAHDFNNLLTIINGYSYLLLQSIPVDSPMREQLEEINKAGERSASLTRQLLAFSRRQVIAPVVLDLNDVVRDTEKMLRRMIGEDIEMATVLNVQLEPVKADPGQLEQLLLNLAVNARDAMPQGGKLLIKTDNVVLDEEYASSHPGVRPGRYAVLAVKDTGVGMTDEVKQHIFEPFFSTKSPGKGTGLGLSVVHGIVKQSEGHFDVESAPGAGACFKIYLPSCEQSGQFIRSIAAATPAPRGSETILLVEDEKVVRRLSVNALMECGYTVLEARSGDEALRLLEQYDGPIHLLVTDVVMPGIGGRALAERLSAAIPNLKVLYVSGYTDDAVVRHGVAYEQVAFLSKPYSPITFAQKIREVLDGLPVSNR
jgi:PAS domain S-box-containing protein